MDRDRIRIAIRYFSDRDLGVGSRSFFLTDRDPNPRSRAGKKTDRDLGVGSRSFFFPDRDLGVGSRSGKILDRDRDLIANSNTIKLT
jgi:hypothetical protein